MEPHDARLEAEVLVIMPALPLGEQLLPAVAILGVGRIRVRFLERRDVGLLLEVAGIDAGAAREQIALHFVDPRRLEHVDVDQHAVAHNHRFVVLDEADPAHLGGEAIDLLDPPSRQEAVVELAEVEDLELVGTAGGVLGELLVDPTDPVALVLEVIDEVVADEATGAGDEDALVVGLAHVVITVRRKPPYGWRQAECTNSSSVAYRLDLSQTTSRISSAGLRIRRSEHNKAPSREGAPLSRLAWCPPPDGAPPLTQVLHLSARRSEARRLGQAGSRTYRFASDGPRRWPLPDSALQGTFHSSPEVHVAEDLRFTTHCRLAHFLPERRAAEKPE